MMGASPCAGCPATCPLPCACGGGGGGGGGCGCAGAGSGSYQSYGSEPPVDAEPDDGDDSKSPPLNCAGNESNQPKSGSTMGSVIDIERRLGGTENTSTSPTPAEDGWVGYESVGG